MSLAFAATCLLPGAAQADPELAMLAKSAAGRFFLTQAAEGGEIATGILGRSIQSQQDFEELLGKIHDDRLSPGQAGRLSERIRDLNSRATGQIEGMESDCGIQGNSVRSPKKAGIQLIPRALRWNSREVPARSFTRLIPTAWK